MGIRMRYFHINNETHIVTNICLWDGVSEYNPSGVYLIPADDFPEVSYGWKKTESGWEAPPEQEQEQI
jgi:hypothetical protein